MLWEISTLGGTPYPGIPTEDLFSYINEGYRMPQPEVCPDEMYDLMTQCWNQNVEERPEFNDLTQIIEKVFKGKLTVQYFLLNFLVIHFCLRYLKLI